MQTKIWGFFLIVLSLIFFAFPAKAAAVSMTIDGPTELVRGEEYDFVVTIDTFNTAITTIQGEVTYEAQYLQFVSLTKGNFFESVTNTEEQTGVITLTGTNSSAKTGSGTFAIIRFKLIAEAPDSSTLCAITPLISETPTPGSPPQSCGLACTSDAQCDTGLACIDSMCLNPACPAEMDCICPVPTKIIIQPSAIPTSGLATGWKIGSFVALGLIGLGILGVILL